MSSQNEQLQATVTQQLSQIQQHKDQYNILKLKLGEVVSTLRFMKHESVKCNHLHVCGSTFR